jgi:hypothetical protein
LTRGDNNSQPDGRLLGPSDILGRVAAARRRNRRRIIYGGLRGHIRGRLLILSRPLKRAFFRAFRDSYRFISTTGLVSGLLPKRYRPRCVEISGIKGGPRLHLVFLGRVVGRFNAERGIWLIRRPYRLFVDEASLPLSKTDSA